MKKKGIIGTVFSLFWLMLIVALLIAFCRVNEVHDVPSLINVARIKSKELGKCANLSVDSETIQCSFRLKVGSYLKNESDLKQFSEKENISIEELRKRLSLSPPNETKKGENSSETPSPSDSKPNQSDTKDSESIVYSNHPGSKLTPDEAKNKLGALGTIPAYGTEPYSRGSWKHWTAPNKKQSCWNAREEALYRQNSGEIVLLDKDGKKTSNKNKACSIQSGHWVDPYSGEIITSPGKLDADHIVPLAMVNKTGGAVWDGKTKENYANDQDVLFITSNKNNRSKGAKGPSSWLPAVSHQCNYAKSYIYILDKYHLQVTEADKTALVKALETCPVE